LRRCTSKASPFHGTNKKKKKKKNNINGVYFCHGGIARVQFWRQLETAVKHSGLGHPRERDGNSVFVSAQQMQLGMRAARAGQLVERNSTVVVPTNTFGRVFEHKTDQNPLFSCKNKQQFDIKQS
jgi:hypothetical protein